MLKPWSLGILLVYCFTSCSLLLLHTGCSREYSFEGRPDTLALIDTLALPVVEPGPVFPSCQGCTTVEKEGEWSCLAGSAIFCGKIDTAIINKERTAFTFFGPSRCSSDSGLIISAYLEEPGLNGNHQNLAINRIAFYYYDNVSGEYMLVSRTQKPMQLVITKYDHLTKKVSGLFTGFAYTTSGKEVMIKSGKFSTFLK
jgi:hypothetical protein